MIKVCCISHPPKKAKPELYNPLKDADKMVLHAINTGVIFSFMLTDEKYSLKVCKHCGKVFLASRLNTVFCSGKCKNQYNVYMSRGKDRKENLPDGE